MPRMYFRFLKWTVAMLTITGVLCFLFIVVANSIVTYSGKNLVFDDVENIEERSVGLVLGTSKTINGKWDNPYFTYRIQAAAKLYKAGKLKHIIVSGDNSFEHYNEPLDMKKALVALNVPDSCITMDFGGRRTLDSVVRCKEIFQQSKVTIISQKSHNLRALLIANAYDIDAIGFNAKQPSNSGVRLHLREYVGARPKALLDLYVLNTKPKFLGNKIDIAINN